MQVARYSRREWLPAPENGRPIRGSPIVALILLVLFIYSFVRLSVGTVTPALLK